MEIKSDTQGYNMRPEMVSILEFLKEDGGMCNGTTEMYYINNTLIALNNAGYEFVIKSNLEGMLWHLTAYNRFVTTQDVEEYKHKYCTDRLSSYSWINFLSDIIISYKKILAIGFDKLKDNE
jgi:hypothetical protein